jgi:hypothetical protein
MNEDERTQAHWTRLARAAHAMQSGVAYEMERGRDAATEPKHLRVGVNAAMVDHAALVRLLVAKGLFTWEEYAKECADEMEREVARYEERANAGGGDQVIHFG